MAASDFGHWTFELEAQGVEWLRSGCRPGQLAAAGAGGCLTAMLRCYTSGLRIV
jgi:uncharacterized OsmC-like protein